MWSRFLLMFTCVVIFSTKSVAGIDNIVCYFVNSNGYKLAPPETLDPNLCTYINYAFIKLDANGSLIAENEALDIDQKMYTRITNLKKINPDLKVLLSVGSTEASVFSAVAADSDKRKIFVESAKYFISTYSFDGLDIDWEKPVANDSDTFVDLLSELKQEFDKYGWNLTAALYPTPDAGYNVAEMSKYLDMFIVMCYNYYGPWSAYTGQNAPLFPSTVESEYEKKYLNTVASIQNWITAGVTRQKLVVGIPFYGRKYTLVDPENHGLHAPITGAGQSPSTPTFTQICEDYANWTTVWDDEQKNPYKYLDDQWLGYDDERSIRAKVQYVVSANLNGVMIWHIGADDIQGDCISKQGLLKVINEEIKHLKF